MAVQEVAALFTADSSFSCNDDDSEVSKNSSRTLHRKEKTDAELIIITGKNLRGAVRPFGPERRGEMDASVPFSVLTGSSAESVMSSPYRLTNEIQSLLVIFAPVCMCT